MELHWRVADVGVASKLRSGGCTHRNRCGGKRQHGEAAGQRRG